MINWPLLYAAAWGVYGMQGGFIPRGVFFAKILCFVLLLISSYHFVVVNLKFKVPRYFVGLNALLGMFFFYGLLSLLGITTHPLPEEYLKSILISLLPIYSFYFFSKTQTISEKNIYQFIILFFVFAFLKFYGMVYAFSLLAKSGEADFTNNAGYLFLPLIAASVFFWRKKFLQYLAICICLIIVIESSKRGAIVTCFVTLAWFLCNDLRGKSIKMKIGVIFVFLVLSSVGYVTFNNHFSESYAFQRKIQDLQEGGGSGRDILYQEFSNHFFYETTPMQFLVGSGANATLTISTNYAHNDWLEIAVNQGLLGVLMYMFYWILFYRESFVKKRNPMIKLALQLVFVDYFMRTFFSMSYQAMTTSATFVLGYCLAKENENEQIVEGL